VTNPEMLRPSRMHVEFALFEKDQLLRHGSLLVTHNKGFSCFGEQLQVAVLRTGNEPAAAHAFSGLAVEHEFELPAARLTLCYFEVRPATTPGQPDLQIQRFCAALQMGIHRSDDWESIDLDGFDFAFRCEPL
jgi:hypothetical protein